jgi:hypothetical protein
MCHLSIVITRLASDKAESLIEAGTEGASGRVRIDLFVWQIRKEEQTEWAVTRNYLIQVITKTVQLPTKAMMMMVVW